MNSETWQPKFGNPITGEESPGHGPPIDKIPTNAHPHIPFVPETNAVFYLLPLFLLILVMVLKDLRKKFRKKS